MPALPATPTCRTLRSTEPLSGVRQSAFTVTIPLAYHTVTTPSGDTSYIDRLLWSEGSGVMVGLTSGIVWTMQRIIGPFHILVNAAGERVAFEATQWWISDSGQRMHVHSTYFLRHDADGNPVAERDVFRCRVL